MIFPLLVYMVKFTLYVVKPSFKTVNLSRTVNKCSLDTFRVTVPPCTTQAHPPIDLRSVERYIIYLEYAPMNLLPFLENKYNVA